LGGEPVGIVLHTDSAAEDERQQPRRSPGHHPSNQL